MIRPFGLRDLPAVRRLQRHGVWLDLGHYLIQRRSPLQTALIAPVPWRGTGLASYVWQDQSGVIGFLQVLKRPGRPEADIQFLAPGLDAAPGAAVVWQKLLEGCIRSAGEESLRRLFACAAEGQAEIDVLAGLGFAPYSNEEIFVLNRAAAATPTEQPEMRPQGPEDSWWLRRLYSLYTPLPVQQAEGLGDKDEPSGLPMAWWEMSQQRGFVLAEGGEVRGAIQIASGRQGHWLLLLGDAADDALMAALIRQGLTTLAGKRWPLYCAARDYQGGLRAVLCDHGFTTLTRCSRLVKHLAVRQPVAERTRVASLAVEQSG